MAQYVTANGMIDYEPSLYAQLGARASGSVWRVYKEIGSRLRKGDVLALIDSAEVGQAKADLLQSLTQLHVREDALRRTKATEGLGAVSERTLTELEAGLREARIKVAGDQQKLLNLGLTIHPDDVAKLSEEELILFLRLLGLPDEIRKTVDPKTLTANLLPLVAPFDGKVVNREVAPGEVVNTAHPKTLFVVADVRQIHIDLEVRLEDMPLVRVGQPVTFIPEGQVEAARAAVSHISPEVCEKTRHVEVHAEAQNPEERLRPHTFGTGRILVGEQPEAVTVPTRAIQSEGGIYLVFVQISERAFQARPVRLGLHDAEFTTVEGVKPGETVVTLGSHVLKSELLKEKIAEGD
jgi:cobalt-zinc-cadmium efflux system membrane fusion protein